MFFPILFRRLMNRLSCASTQYSTQFLFTHPPPCGSFPPALSFSYWVLTSLEVLTHPHRVFSCLYTTFLSIVLVFVFCVLSRAIPYQGVPLMAGCPRFLANNGSLFAPSRWLVYDLDTRRWQSFCFG